MYYATEKYSLTFNFLEEIEENFIKDIKEYIIMKPFAWNEITNKILYDRLITYVKDTTFIITLYAVKTNSLKYLFELLKELLRKGYVTRIIYKEEFIIVHLYSILITKVLSSYNYWLVALSYSVIKNNNFEFEIFLNVFYESKDNSCYIDSVIFKNNYPKTFILSNYNKSLEDCSISKVLLYIYRTIEHHQFEKYFFKKIKFNYDIEKYKENLLEELIN